MAVKWIERAVALRPGVAGYHANLGLAWQAQGRLVEAAEEFGKVLALNPEDAAVHVNRGVIVRAMGQKALALEHFRRAIELQSPTGPGPDEPRRTPDGTGPARRGPATLPGPRSPWSPLLVEAHINLGNVLRVLGRLPEARASYFEAMRIDPTRGQAASGLGLTALPEESWDEAMGWLRTAVTLEPRSVEFLRYLAEAASARKLYPEVQSCCERILEIDPDHAIAHNSLGCILHEAGRHDEARQQYQTVIHLKPDLAVAYHNLGVLEEELGDLAEAESLFRRTLRLEPAHATTMARLATLLGAALSDARSRRSIGG